MKDFLKWGGILLVIAVVLNILTGGSKNINQQASNPSPTPIASSMPDETKKESEQPQATATPNPTPTPAPKVFDIKVTSQIAKKVDGKHRYFFDIRNHDTSPFEGSVTISLYNDKQSSQLGGDTFNTTQAIEPSLGTSVNFSINTGPKSVHGDYGITKFKYSVKQGDDIVASGEGNISDKYEDLTY